MTESRRRPRDQRLETQVQLRLDHVEAEGVSVGVRSGTQRAYVSRGAVAGRPVDERSVMYAASVAKQFVGVLLAYAVEARLLSADDPVQAWLPEVTGPWAPLRLHHLLHHTAGIPDVTDPDRGVPRSNAEILERLRGERPTSEPGTEFAYCNAGYVLLAEVLESATGHAVGRLAWEQLLQPLALTRTWLTDAPPGVDVTPAPPGTIGDGGLWTCVADLLTWLEGLDGGRPNHAAVRRAETPGQLSDGTPLAYAWGMRVVATPLGRRITHGGSWGPWQAKTVRLPEHQVDVAVLSLGGEETVISELAVDLAADLATDPGRQSGS